MRFVSDQARDLCPISATGFDPLVSLALGGLANAWGAGLYRFTEDDLRGFPLGPEELAPFYDTLTAKIGISGAADDLLPFFGTADGLQPPLRLGSLGRRILRRYERLRRFVNGRGLYLGRPRLGVLTTPHDGRPPYDYSALEFFRTGNQSVYTPALTMRELVATGRVRHQDKILVESFEASGDALTVRCRDLSTAGRGSFTCRRLLLAASPLNTARIVLRSRGDQSTRLPLLDNAVSYVPLVEPLSIGAATDRYVYPGAMLNGVYSAGCGVQTIQMSVYGLDGPLRSDFLTDFPLSLRGNLAAALYLTPAIAMAQLFYPDDPEPSNSVRLTRESVLEIRYTAKRLGAVEARLVRTFAIMGLIGHPGLCRYLAPGSSFHYGGCLPMRAHPRGPYETDVDGRLACEPRVVILDASTFPRLPAKNHGLTIMANAMRIASRV
jgi:choline dehydrogenase-like flavoprotein